MKPLLSPKEEKNLIHNQMIKRNIQGAEVEISNKEISKKAELPSHIQRIKATTEEIGKEDTLHIVDLEKSKVKIILILKLEFVRCLRRFHF